MPEHPSQYPSPSARRRLRLGALAVLVLSAAARPVGASAPVHTALTSSAPSADSTARAPVRELRLVFSTAVQPALTTIVLTGPRGALPVGALEVVPGTGDMELRVPLLAALPNGAYTVEWLTAGPDSHPINGTFGFTVDVPAPPEAAAPSAAPGGGGDREGERREPLAEDTAVPGFLPTAVRWMLDLSTVLLIGLAAFRWVILERLRTERAWALVAFPALRRLWVMGWSIAALILALLPLRLGVLSLQLFGSDAVTRGGALLGSAWGTSWWLNLGAGALLATGLLLAGAQGRAAGWIAVALGAALSTVVPGLAGHPWGTPLPAVMVMNDAVHVTAAGVWVGGLMMVLAVGLPALREADVPAELGGGAGALASLAASFSKLALVAVAVLAFTGVVNARVILGSWAALFGSRYGQTLLVKVALVALTGLLGLYHWLVVRPELERGGSAERFETTARIELVLGLLVVVATAVLASTAPMGPEVP